MADEWNKQKAEDMVGLWQGQPCLYNTKSPDYKNQDKRAGAFDLISKEIGVSVGKYPA